MNELTEQQPKEEVKPEPKAATAPAEKVGKKIRLGCFPHDDYTEFRLFCPRAEKVFVEIFHNYEQKSGIIHEMNKNGGDIWQVTIKENHVGKFYGYRIVPIADEFKDSEKDICIADPYSKMVASRNHYLHFPKTLIFKKEEFDWEGDDFVTPEDPRDLVIYEAHLKDLTAHESSGCSKPGTYLGLIEDDINGGINHLKKIGVNAIELLPLHKFPLFEPPHLEPISEGVINTWNYYGRNYWGYMTSFFFCPETIYASDGDNAPAYVSGKTTAAIREFKEMVKAFHKNGITVIMDVVYNHASQYDHNPFKLIDKEHYFRLDENGNYLSESGCGNDFRTESEMGRKMIVESIKYWMEEFHIDGFRFDLANLIDRETVDMIREEAQKINPNVVLIAEPWGGGYDPEGFSHRGWPSWNDQIRNGVKGSDPVNDRGFIFGEWQSATSRDALENFMRGTLLDRSNGRYTTAAHAVNYLESHDGYTLGDFIRIGLDTEKVSRVFKSRDKLVKLKRNEVVRARLAALYLFVSQGITMIHEGQEWGRTKVVVPHDEVHDPYTGRIDHNSYEKDNETNYLNFEDISQNQSLFQFYCGLIGIRLDAPALRKSPPEAIQFWNYSDSLHITCTINGEAAGDPYDYIVSLNGNHWAVHSLTLPKGVWEIIATETHADKKGFDVAAEKLSIPPSGGYILRKLRNSE